MTIAPLDPGDAVAMEKWYDLRVAATHHDVPDLPSPSRREHLARFEHPWPASTDEALLAWDGDRVAGAAWYLLPQAEDLSTVHLELIVHPRHRRRGIGTQLLEEVYAAARRHDRSLIEIATVRALPGGVARDEAGYHYLTNRAHQPGVTSIRSRCEIAGPVWPLAAGYSLVQWRDAAPEKIIKDVAALQSRLMPERQYDPARVRAQEATELGRGYHWYSTAARYDATGQIVARTKLSFEANDDTHARQRITIVEPPHRGRRLGLIVKSANHAYARANEPALQAVDTWNAEENTHMRAVNAQLGFQPVDAWPAFRLPVPAAAASPAGPRETPAGHR